jgi:aminopeptidase-like protein
MTPPIDLHGLVRKLFPFTRSLTGEGVRQTLRTVQSLIPLEIVEVPSGTPVLDWEVPDEWTFRRATISHLNGQVLVDTQVNNLHVVGYSQPVHGVMTRDELARHVHTLPDRPDAIPYRTGYYANSWGFCLSHRQWQSMDDASYRVDIDSQLAPGHLSYGEYFLPGSEPGEILISVHVCHPSLADDNLSGIAIATGLAMCEAARSERRLGIRFLYLPATIGPITWLDRNQDRVGSIRHGLVLTCLGDPGPFHYKQSRSGAAIDRAVAHVLEHGSVAHEVLPFSPYGYDERQYCSPGFDLPVGCLMRGVHGTFPQYHTSDDNLDFVTPAALDESFAMVAAIVDLLQDNRTLTRVDGRGEPQLGRRGLYRAIAGQSDGGGATQLDLLWVLNLADGRHTLLDMAARAKVPFTRLVAAARLALDAQLVEEIR